MYESDWVDEEWMNMDNKPSLWETLRSLGKSAAICAGIIVAYCAVYTGIEAAVSKIKHQKEIKIDKPQNQINSVDTIKYSNQNQR